MYLHPSNADCFDDWRSDGDFWFYALFERDAYYI